MRILARISPRPCSEATVRSCHATKNATPQTWTRFRRQFRTSSGLQPTPKWCNDADSSTTAAVRAKSEAPSTPQSSLTASDLNAGPALIYPQAINTGHHDLASFMDYTERTGLNRNSTVYVGTRFEYIVADVLARYGFYLRRVGGMSDKGIDLLGTWTVSAPSPSRSSSSSARPPIKVLVQCKAGRRSPVPHLIRELEGSVASAPVGWRGSGVVGLLVTEKPATSGVRDALGRSKTPMGFISCTKEGRLTQFAWNRRAEEEGLEGLGIGVRYTEHEEQELVLTMNGKHLPMHEPK